LNKESATACCGSDAMTSIWMRSISNSSVLKLVWGQELRFSNNCRGVAVSIPLF
jgi:hypothetical protein